jgi:DNA excision repair protein ERCC-3
MSLNNMSGPIIIQSDNSVLLETQHPQFESARDFLSKFAELIKSPEFIHTYRITPLSLWNAAAIEISLDEILSGLQTYAKYQIPENVITNLQDWFDIYGKLTLYKHKNNLLRLEISENSIFNRIINDDNLEKYWHHIEANQFYIDSSQRGNLKQDLIKAGYPVQDLCGYVAGNQLEIGSKKIDLEGEKFDYYPYQKEAIEAFYESGNERGGSGVIVLPCGSGKTIVGIGVIDKISSHTIIITTNNVAAHQWRHELLDKTNLSQDMIGEYTGAKKIIKPITITTYQMMTHRKSTTDDFKHINIFTDYNWGLIIYDEVHMLPAPVFRVTTNIQSKRRLGLTATLVREDGKEDEVFALIGPKKYDLPWKVLEQQGYISRVYCTEFRIKMPGKLEVEYAYAKKRKQFRLASENPRKIQITEELISNHNEDSILVIGYYISQLEEVASELGLPIITGKTKEEEREKLYEDFRNKRINTLVVSKVANFAVDLPDANIMIQLSGTFGSRQEEAQRLGRILRPKKKRSHFYTLVSKGSREQDFAINRQMFLVEQGYKYHIEYF